MKMKRLVIIAILLIGFAFCGCSSEFFTAIRGSLNTPMLLPSESEAHFEKLEQVLKETADSHELELKKVRSKLDEGGIIVDYELKPDERSTIKLSLHNILLDGKTKGAERFSVFYEKSDRSTGFDIALFTAIANSVSGRTLTDDFCLKLVSDTDGTFAEISTNGAPGWMHKFKTLDKYGNWSLSEELLMDETKLDSAENDYTELLYFEGLTSACKRGIKYAYSENYELQKSAQGNRDSCGRPPCGNRHDRCPSRVSDGGCGGDSCFGRHRV